MKNKRHLPLAILKALEPFVDDKTNLFETVKTDEDYLVEAVDKKTDSDFFFYIKEYKKSNNGRSLIALIGQRPTSDINPGFTSSWAETSTIESHFNSWLSLLQEYNEVKSFYDDPILDHYEEKYFTDFTESFGNEDQDKPFNTE